MEIFDNPWALIIIAVLFVVLFGSKRLPDGARALGRSMRILKSEVKGLHEDDAAATVPVAAAAPLPAVEPVAPAAPVVAAPVVAQTVAVPIAAPAEQPVAAAQAPTGQPPAAS